MLSMQLLAARIGFKSEVGFLLTMLPPNDLKEKKFISPFPITFTLLR